MKRLYIVVEGQTEELFVNRFLAPYLSASQQLHSVTPIAIHRGQGARGGMVNYECLRRDVLRLLRERDAPIVSTLIDFFRCPETPGKDIWGKATNHLQEVELREKEIGQDIANEHFIPYIQLHEFEALLFSSDASFGDLFSEKEAKELSKVVAQYPNPEEINTTPEGAPSKRLQAIVSDYRKTVHVHLIAEAIGIEVILERCPRFRTWVERLIRACCPN